MIILALYPVDNSLGWERHEFDCLDDDMTFKKMWEEQDGLEAHFYQMDSKSYSGRLLNGAEFEEDYNDEYYDGGFWCKVLIVDDEFAKKVIEYETL